jgi:hypothetical protein
MTEIEFQPIKKIVILEELKYDSINDLFADMVAGVPPDVPIALLWLEGVVFRHSAMPPQSEEIVKNRIQGTVYWDNVGYARMDTYERKKSFGMHTIKIIKATAPALIDAAKKLKERL